MVSLSDDFLGSLSGLDELRQGDVVGEVLVEVVLVHLNIVHFLANDIVLSHSWEGETLVHQFPGSHHWQFLAEFTSDGRSLVVVRLIEGSGEVLHVHLQVLSGDLELTCGLSVALGEAKSSLSHSFSHGHLALWVVLINLNN